MWRDLTLPTSLASSSCLPSAPHHSQAWQRSFLFFQQWISFMLSDLTYTELLTQDTPPCFFHSSDLSISGHYLFISCLCFNLRLLVTLDCKLSKVWRYCCPDFHCTQKPGMVLWCGRSSAEERSHAWVGSGVGLKFTEPLIPWGLCGSEVTEDLIQGNTQCKEDYIYWLWYSDSRGQGYLLSIALLATPSKWQDGIHHTSHFQPLSKQGEGWGERGDLLHWLLFIRKYAACHLASPPAKEAGEVGFYSGANCGVGICKWLLQSINSICHKILPSVPGFPDLKYRDNNSTYWAVTVRGFNGSICVQNLEQRWHIISHKNPVNIPITVDTAKDLLHELANHWVGLQRDSCRDATSALVWRERGNWRRRRTLGNTTQQRESPNPQPEWTKQVIISSVPFPLGAPSSNSSVKWVPHLIF